MALLAAKISSVRITKTENEAPVFKLPEELLLHVACFLVSDSDILNLRLTHRKLYQASMDRFAEEFLSSIDCAFLAPVRLLRAQQITSSPHLAARVKQLRITSSPFENREIMPIVFEKGGDYGDEDFQWRQVLHAEVYTPKAVTLTTPPSINWALTKCILENLKYHPNCRLLLEAHVDYDVDECVKQYSSSFAEDFFALSVQVGRLIDAIELSDRCRLRPSNYEKGGSLWPALQNLVHLEHRSIDSDDEPQGLRNAEKAHYKALGNIFRESPKLRTVCWPKFLEVWHIPLLPDRFPALTTLKVGDTGCDVRCSVLIELLTRCTSTLITLDLYLQALCYDSRHHDHIPASEAENPWTTLFRELLQMPKLETIHIWDATFRCREDRDCGGQILFQLPGNSEAREDLYEEGFEDSDEDEGPEWQDVDEDADEDAGWQGSTPRRGVASRPFLELNLECGFRYIPWREYLPRL